MTNIPTGPRSGPSPLGTLHLRRSEHPRAIPRDLNLIKKVMTISSKLLSFCIFLETQFHLTRMNSCPRIPRQICTFGHPDYYLRPHIQLPTPASTIHPSRNIPRCRKFPTQKYYSNMAPTQPIVAVLYQALPPPTYGGVSKPPKPGGRATLVQSQYQDKARRTGPGTLITHV